MGLGAGAFGAFAPCPIPKARPGQNIDPYYSALARDGYIIITLHLCATALLSRYDMAVGRIDTERRLEEAKLIDSMNRFNCDAKKLIKVP